MTTYMAHSENGAKRAHTQEAHLTGVAQRAAAFAAAFGAAEEARFAGLLHDLGKYGDLFQQRLRGQAHHIDHWSMGARLALLIARIAGVASALAIHGHHIGLQRYDVAKDKLQLAYLTGGRTDGLRLSECEAAVLQARFAQDGGCLTPPPGSIVPPTFQQESWAARMLDVRMLFSALVDADFLDTEAHFNTTDVDVPWQRPPAPFLDPVRALDIVSARLAELERRGETTASRSMMQVRDALLRACRDHAPQPVGLWTLTAPTGSGKTLAMLAFALQHAATHGLRRIVMVIPYLSIIEQTARIYRELFAPHFGPAYVLEHHSLAGTRPVEEEGVDDGQERQARLTAENWDAPLIITTSVQMLESLFANRPSACRKLHRLAQSVILFDEVQSLPARLAIPTLATLSHLSSRYHTTVVFSTATQPAFNHLDANVRAIGESGWQPREIVDSAASLFDGARRTTVIWPDPDATISWEALADALAAREQVLCIVNKKAHAATLVHLLQERACTAYHLSTAMCPAHRQAVLSAVHTALALGKPCRLIATQCIEAGVDVDFPVAYRAFGPLEAIAQAAGRCNRHGLRPDGEVRVFTPDLDERAQYPLDGVYRQAAGITRKLLREHGSAGMDIHNPALFTRYYRQLYDLARPHDETREDNRRLLEAIQCLDFPEVAARYRLIEKAGINVLVPYDPAAYDALETEARGRGLTAEWMRRAQPHAVSLYEYESTHYAMAPVPVRRGKITEESTEWFLLRDDLAYDQTVGLSLGNDTAGRWTV